MLVLISSLFALVEAIVQVGKMLFRKDMEAIHYIVFCLGAFVAWFFGLNVFEIFDVVPAITNEIAILVFNLLLAGVLFVRYSGAVNDLLEFVKSRRNG